MLDIDLVLLESDSASFGQSMYQGPVYIVVIMVNRVRNADDVNNHLELRPVKRKITEKKEINTHNLIDMTLISPKTVPIVTALFTI